MHHNGLTVDSNNYTTISNEGQSYGSSNYDT